MNDELRQEIREKVYNNTGFYPSDEYVETWIKEYQLENTTIGATVEERDKIEISERFYDQLGFIPSDSHVELAYKYLHTAVPNKEHFLKMEVVSVVKKDNGYWFTCLNDIKGEFTRDFPLALAEVEAILHASELFSLTAWLNSHTEDINFEEVQIFARKNIVDGWIDTANTIRSKRLNKIFATENISFGYQITVQAPKNERLTLDFGVTEQYLMGLVKHNKLDLLEKNNGIYRYGKTTKKKEATKMTTTGTANTNFTKVPLVAINDLDKRFQVRLGKLDSDNVNALIATNKYIPPIRLVERDGKYVIVSGFHRTEARKIAKQEFIDAEILPASMPDEDLLLLAYSDNMQHGKQLSSKEKRKYIVAVYLKDPTKKYYIIGQELGVSVNTVESAVKEYFEAQKQVENTAAQPDEAGTAEAIKKETEQVNKIVKTGEKFLKSVENLLDLGDEEADTILRVIAEDDKKREKLYALAGLISQI